MTRITRVELFGGPRDGETHSVTVIDGVFPVSISVATPTDTARYARDPREPVTGLTPRYRYTPGA